MPGSHGERGAWGRLRRHGSRGVASVEYALLVGLIGAGLCLGIGATVKTLFDDSLNCFIAQIRGGTSASCSGGGGSPDPGPIGDPPGGAPVPSTSPLPTPSVSPSPSPSP